jgi:putative transposase
VKKSKGARKPKEDTVVLYRRNIVERGTYFFTVTLRDRQSDYLIHYIELFKKVYRIVKSRTHLKR